MSQLVLIRHGQAAAFTADSDRLTDLGERQGAVLGAYFVNQGISFDEVVIGGLRRHAQTEAQVAAEYRKAGRPWPKAECMPGWNEYDAGAILTALEPRLLAEAPGFDRLVADYRAHARLPDKNRYFQRMFEAAMTHWVAGSFDVPDVESFANFHARVSAALDQVVQGDRSRRVAVFTSGGPIGVSVQRTLQAPKGAAIDVNWRVRNASLTELLFGKGRVSLDSFNLTSHFTDSALVTFR